MKPESISRELACRLALHTQLLAPDAGLPSGKEGATYHGVDVDFPVPAQRDTEGLIDALSAAEWGVQKRLLNICEECLRVCPAHRSRGG